MLSEATLTAHGTIDGGGQLQAAAIDNSTAGRYYAARAVDNRIIEVDPTQRAITATWPTGCDRDRARSLAFDGRKNILFVACEARLISQDTQNNGKIVHTLELDGDIGKISYDPVESRLFVASGRPGSLTANHVNSDGSIVAFARTTTCTGCRSVLAEGGSTAYIPDPANAQIRRFVLESSPGHAYREPQTGSAQ